VNKFQIALILIFLVPSFSGAKTVKDIIKDIKKKQGDIPVYKMKRKRKRDRVNLAIVQPSTSFSAVFPEGSAERNYEEKLNKEIAQLQYLSKRLNGRGTKQQVLVRLAKGYSEKAALIERREQEQYDKKLKMYFAGSRSSKPSLRLSDSRKYNKKALDLYKYYIKTYPRAKDLDQAYFFLGYNSMGLGQTKSAIGYYKKLSDRFPNSDYIDEANLSLGDYYFDKDRRSSAKSYYEKVAKDSRSPLGSLALYKLSWVNYKIGNHQQALKGLLKVIRLAKDAGVRNKKSVALAEEAKKDLPMFYAEAGDPRNALTYFTNIMTRDEAARAIEKLAYYYVDKGDKQEAQYLFAKLIKLNPENDKSFDYQYSLVNMQASTGRDDLYEAELYKWVSQFGPKSQWAGKSKDRKKVADSLDKAEISLRSHVLQIHNESREQKSKAKMLRAEKGYQIYLSNFEEGKNVDEMRFYYGELLYEMGAYKDAYLAYTKVKGSKYGQKASLNAVLSLEKTIPKDETVRKKIGKSTKKFPLDSDEERFIKAANTYLSDIKNREQRVDIKYRVASIYYSHNYFDDSEKVFKEIIKEFPSSKYAAFSSDLIIDSYKLKKDYAGLEKAGKELIQIGEKSGGVKTSKVESVLEQSAFKRVEAISKTAKPLEVAGGFMKFTKDYPKSALQRKAFYNAGIYYEKAGAFNKALAAYTMVDASQGDKKLYNDAQKFSAFLYEKMGYLRRAAALYENLSGSSSASPKDKLKYLTSAAIIKEGFNDVSGLKSILLKLKPLDKVNNTYLYDYRIAEVYQRIGNLKAARTHYMSFFNTAKASPFLLVKSARRIGDSYLNEKNLDRSKYWFRAAVLTYEKFKSRGAKGAVSDAAYSKFKLSDELFYTYLGIKIPSDPSKQQRVITDKLKLVDKITKEMAKVIDFDDGYTIVSALNRQGQAYQHLTFAILTTPLPGGLNLEEQKTVKGLIEKKVEPFKLNAITSYKKALEKGRSLNTYNAEYLNTLYELSKIDSSFAKYKIPFIVDDKTIQFDVKTAKDHPEAIAAARKTEDAVLAEFGKKLASDSGDFKALFSLANYYHYKGFSKISNLFIEKMSKKDSTRSEVHNLKGLNELIENDKRKAVKEFNLSLKANSSNVAAALNLSSQYAKFGGFEAAYDLLKDKHSSSNLPSMVKQAALNNYALGLIAKNRIDEAAAEFKEAISLSKDHLPSIGNMAILSTTIRKNKKQSNQYLGQYKKLAKSQVDLDRIDLLESVQL